jgi:hypothetical protein
MTEKIKLLTDLYLPIIFQFLTVEIKNSNTELKVVIGKKLHHVVISILSINDDGIDNLG